MIPMTPFEEARFLILKNSGDIGAALGDAVVLRRRDIINDEMFEWWSTVITMLDNWSIIQQKAIDEESKS